MAFNYGKRRTAAEASAEVDSYVQPRDCFIWYIDNKWGWQSFSATGDTPCPLRGASAWPHQHTRCHVSAWLSRTC